MTVGVSLLLAMLFLECKVPGYGDQDLDTRSSENTADA